MAIRWAGEIGVMEEGSGSDGGYCTEDEAKSDGRSLYLE